MLNTGKTTSSMRIVMFGLSITSSWGNGHATFYRGLVRELAARGHDVLFLERDMPWYAATRDLSTLTAGRCELYADLEDLRRRFSSEVRFADVVMLGSFVPQGAEIGKWVLDTTQGLTSFYDLDTAVTLNKLERGDCEYLSAKLIPQYDLYFSFAGGPILQRLQDQYGARRPHPLHAAVDPWIYYPESCAYEWDLGYMGTYSEDRQAALERLVLEPARKWKQGKFVVAGPQYPRRMRWPRNVMHIEHLPPDQHRHFYNAQRFTLNLTRGSMKPNGYCPNVRLFEAAACGTPIISDYWPGLEDFFKLGSEVLLAHSAADNLLYLKEYPEEHRVRLGERARDRVLTEHTADQRALEFENYVLEALAQRATVEESRSRVLASTSVLAGAAAGRARARDNRVMN